ncbi:serine hydrolase domain-containing protein [Fulvivirgaceae bacterium BMA10]|uniref:Serine hydrolase domain-containing protein n=1 Tax=Splendidivirga corallicola TaxID=3051826 RepID=A0ABT8KJY0_9BACT|nr:serine hydrolase domain-containing protein [Fulvivirgaceae bacterium BMA10]
MNLRILLPLILLLSCTSPEKKNQNSSELDNLESGIDSLFNSKIDKNGAGAALLVSYNGEKLIGKGFGLRDIEKGLPVTPNTNMRMGSVSKQFTVLALLSLIDKGIISLTDSVFNIYPFETFKRVKIEQLINHTSGIADAEAAFFTEWDQTKIAENKNLVDWYSQNPEPYFEPGVKWQYNNGAYELLASIVERIGEVEFAAFVKQNILEKVDMQNSNFFNLAKPMEIKERAYCYQRDSLENWQRVDGHFLNGLLGAGGLYTSVNDFFKYDQALRNKSLLSEDLHQLIFKPSSMPFPQDGDAFKYNAEFPFVGNDDQYYAMGWFVSGQTAFHSGSWFGTRTFVIYELDRPLTIAIFLNSDASSIRKELIDKTYQLVDNYLQTIANK